MSDRRGRGERRFVGNVIWGADVPAVITGRPLSIVQYTVLIKCELCVLPTPGCPPSKWNSNYDSHLSFPASQSQNLSRVMASYRREVCLDLVLSLL